MQSEIDEVQATIFPQEVIDTTSSKKNDEAITPAKVTKKEEIGGKGKKGKQDKAEEANDDDIEEDERYFLTVNCKT